MWLTSGRRSWRLEEKAGESEKTESLNIETLVDLRTGWVQIWVQTHGGWTQPVARYAPVLSNGFNVPCRLDTSYGYQ